MTNLFQVADSGLIPLTRAKLATEEELENWIAKDPRRIGLDVLIIGRQVQTPFGNRIDLLSALAQTAPTFATPVLLRDGWGFGYQEIATLLEIPEGTVKSRVHEGRRRLQRTLAG